MHTLCALSLSQAIGSFCLLFTAVLSLYFCWPLLWIVSRKFYLKTLFSILLFYAMILCSLINETLSMQICKSALFLQHVKYEFSW